MHDTEEDSCSTVPQTRGPCYALTSSPEAYADLVTVAGFKPVVAAEKPPGGFDSLPLPFCGSSRQEVEKRNSSQRSPGRSCCCIRIRFCGEVFSCRLAERGDNEHFQRAVWVFRPTSVQRSIHTMPRLSRRPSAGNGIGRTGIHGNASHPAEPRARRTGRRC